MKVKNNINLSLIVVHFVILLVVATMVFPLIWMALTSLKPPVEVNTWPPMLFPKLWTFENYQFAFQTANFLRFMFNSLAMGVVGTISILITSCSLGYILAKYKFPGKEIIFIAILATIMIPLEAYIVPLFSIVVHLRLVNTYMGLFLPNFVASSGIFFMRQNISSIPDELIDAARVDGASEFFIFSKVIIPLSISALSALGIFMFMFIWTSFLWPLVIIGSEKIMTMEVGLTMFESLDLVAFGPLMAASTLGVLPVFLAFVILRSRVTDSVAATGFGGK